MDSATNSALISQQSSRASTPMMIHQHQLNPYRLPRFWRGYALGGLTTIGAYGLYKLGSALKNHFNNKFHRQQSTASVLYNPYRPPALPTPNPTPKPTRYQKRNRRVHKNRHY